MVTSDVGTGSPFSSRIALPSVRLDQVIAHAKLKLHLGGQSLVSTDQLDRVSRHDVLEGEQNQRNAQKYRMNREQLPTMNLPYTTPI